MLSLAATLMTAVLLTACDNDSNESLQEKNVYTTYSNKLSVGSDANLTLRYSGEEMVGRDVIVNIPDGKTATIVLRGIIAGDETTTLSGVTLAQGDTCRTFSGSATAENTATTFSYSGTIGNSGAMVLDIYDVKVPQGGLLQGTTTLQTVTYTGSDGVYDGEGTTYSHSVFYKLSVKNAENTNLVQLAYVMFLNTMFNNLLNLTLYDVTFNADGNITARYADLPEGTELATLLDYGGVARPDESQFKQSPGNLAMYYFVNDTSMRVIPNIDNIISTVEKNATRADITDNATLQLLQKVTALLARWSTTGVSLTFIKDPNVSYAPNADGNLVRYTGDYVVYLDIDDAEYMTAILDFLLAAVPESTLQTDVFELLEKAGVELPDDVEELMPAIKEMLGDTTLGGIINTLKSNLDDIDEFKIGLYLK